MYARTIADATNINTATALPGAGPGKPSRKMVSTMRQIHIDSIICSFFVEFASWRMASTKRVSEMIQIKTKKRYAMGLVEDPSRTRIVPVTNHAARTAGSEVLLTSP